MKNNLAPIREETRMIIRILKELSIVSTSHVLIELKDWNNQRKTNENNPRNITPAMSLDSQTVWQRFLEKVRDKEKELEVEEGYLPPEDWSQIDKIGEGIGDIFSTENGEFDRAGGLAFPFGTLIGARMFGPLAGIGCYGNGDWEFPVFFIIYIGTDDQFHSYVPKNGNTFNHNSIQAFGNSDDDFSYLTSWAIVNGSSAELDENILFENVKLIFNEKEILLDIAENVHVIK